MKEIILIIAGLMVLGSVLLFIRFHNPKNNLN